MVASEKWGVVRIGLSLAKMAPILAQKRRQIVTLTIGVILIGVLVAIVLGKAITKPIYKLIQGATAISGGDLTRKIEVKTGGEVGRLARAFNQMAEKLRGNRKDLERANRRLLTYAQELEKKLSDLSALKQASLVLNSSFDLKKKCNLIVNTAVSITRAKKGFLMFTDERKDNLNFEVSQGNRIKKELYETIAREVMRSGKPILINKGAPNLPWGKLLEEDKVSSIMCVPLKIRGRVLGTTAVEDPMSGKDFTESDLELFSTFANEAVLALENASLTESLIQSRELDSFNRLTSIIIHDLKGSITRLSFLVRNVERNYQDPEFQADLTATISDTVGKMEDLVAKLAGPARLLELRPQSLNLLIQRIVAKLNLRGMRDIELIEEYDELPEIMIDKENMQRVFRNLILNGLEAMPNGGKLKITSRHQGEPPAVVIEIADTGQGMTEEFINENLFKPFRTTKRKGLGLALFSSREVVSLHGGKIDVKSQLGKGTTFTIELPILMRGERTKVIRKLLGEYLVETGTISKEQLQRAIEIQTGKKRMIGKILIDLGYVREREIAFALQKQKEAEKQMLDMLWREGLNYEHRFNR